MVLLGQLTTLKFDPNLWQGCRCAVVREVLCCVVLCSAVQVSRTDPPRFGSLKQRLKEVKRARQQKNSSRPSSIISNSTDDSSVITESSSVVEAKLEKLLLQVSAGSPEVAQSSPNRGTHENRADQAEAEFSSSRAGRSVATGLLGRAILGKLAAGGCAPKGLGVTVRRCAAPRGARKLYGGGGVRRNGDA
jgi:hypothetical protein